jgi:diketogulonate reductase-like aldo/keto reductase
MKRRQFIYSLANLLLIKELLANQQNAILQRAIPSTGEKLPVVGLGTWRVFDVGGNEAERKIRSQVLDNLVRLGGKIIDTSPMYGSSQAVVGDLSNDLKTRSSLFFANKVWTTGRESGIEQMNDSFAKMKTKVIDLMQVHNLVDVKTHLRTLTAMKEEGKIRYIGITHYLQSAYPQLISLIKSEKIDFVHFNYNIANREAENVLLPLASDKGLAVITNRPFDEGGLFETLKHKKLPDWAKEEGMNSWASFLLKFVISHPHVTYTIPATTNPLHLIENLQSASSPLPDASLRRKMVQYFETL